jgi:hypothetical protein
MRTPILTGETQEVIAARKLNFPWGRWLKGGSAEEEEEAGGSDASAQTDACEAGCSHHHHPKRAGSAVSDDVGQGADTDQVGEIVGGTVGARPLNACSDVRILRFRSPFRQLRMLRVLLKSMWGPAD